MRTANRRVCFLLIGAFDLSIGEVIGWHFTAHEWLTTWPLYAIVPSFALLHLYIAMKLFPE